MSLSNQALSYAWQPDNRDTPVNHANRRNRNYGVTHRPSSTVTKKTVAKLAWRSALYTSRLPAYTGRKWVEPYLYSPHNAFTAWTGTPLPYRPTWRTAYLLKFDEPCLEVLGRTTLDEWSARRLSTQDNTYTSRHMTYICKRNSSLLPQCSRGHKALLSSILTRQAM